MIKSDHDHIKITSVVKCLSLYGIFSDKNIVLLGKVFSNI